MGRDSSKNDEEEYYMIIINGKKCSQEDEAEQDVKNGKNQGGRMRDKYMPLLSKVGAM